jgi:Bacterial Ig-like domain (group 3)
MITVNSRRRIRTQRRRALAILAGILLGIPLAVAVTSASAQALATGQWQFTGSLAAGHGQARLAQLPDGRVLAISGYPVSGAATPAAAAEIYDPGTGQWASAGSLNIARAGYGQPSVLPDGRVLVATGDVADSVETNTAEIYDPSTNAWSFTGSLSQGRRNDVQVELANGEVLVATGANGGPTCGRFLSSAELYNPATGQWTSTGATLVPREGATAIRLADGRVLLAGGYNGGTNCTDTDPVDSEIYDPATGQWSFAGNLPHGWMSGAMVLLPDHRVLMVDGWQHGSGGFTDAVAFDPATNQWSEIATPLLTRVSADLTLLPDGDILVAQGGGQFQSEIYDPAANTWSLDATTLDENNPGQTFLLPNGTVLLAGGYNNNGPTTATELYTPPQAETSTTITSSANPSAAGQQVTYTAAVSPVPGGGTVSFTDNGSSIAGCTTVPVSGNTAACTATPQTSGTHNIVAAFSGSSGFAGSTSAPLTQLVTGCPPGTKANFRWHYSANGSAGGWSGTATQACPGSFSMGPQAMEGRLTVTPGATLKAGYDFTLPGNKNSLTIGVAAAQVTFAVSCVSGAAPSASTMTVAMPAQAYQVTSDQWYPSGNQSSPLVYQGSVTVPDLCSGGTLSLAHGGTFSATLG